MFELWLTMEYISCCNTGIITGDSLFFRCGAASIDSAKLTLNYSSITTPLTINSVTQLQILI